MLSKFFTFEDDEVRTFADVFRDWRRADGCDARGDSRSRFNFKPEIEVEVKMKDDEEVIKKNT